MRLANPPVHPGEILREEYLPEYGITTYRLAKDLGVPATRMADILAGRRGITADTALRLSRYFGTTPNYWLNLQTTYELQLAERDAGRDYQQVQPARRPGLVGVGD